VDADIASALLDVDDEIAALQIFWIRLYCF